MLAQVFYGTSLNQVSPGWLDNGDHCGWTGVTCDGSNKKVTSLVMEDLNLTGDYPSTLNKLSALTALTTDGNGLTGEISAPICDMSGIQIVGDETNCPNDVGISGCCSAVRLTDPSPYLDGIVAEELGSSICGDLSSSDSLVCGFMKDDKNHYIFGDDQYPGSFPYADWLRVSYSEDWNCIDMVDLVLNGDVNTPSPSVLLLNDTIIISNCFFIFVLNYSITPQ